MKESNSMAATTTAKQQHFDISVFSGLRVLASFTVVYGHVLYFLPFMLPTPVNVLLTPAAQAFEPLLTVLSLLCVGFFNYSVDVFFFMSGYLFGPSFLSSSSSSSSSSSNDKQQRCTIRNSVYHMMSRWLRLLPMYGIAWTVAAFRDLPGCRRFPGVLYEAFGFLNLHPMFIKKPMLDVTCLLVAWSLSADVQAHIFLCFVLLLTRARPRLTCIFISSAVLLQVYVRAQFVFGLDHAMLPMETSFDLTGRDPTLARTIGSALGLPVSSALSPMTTAQDILTAKQMTDDARLYFDARYRTGPALIGFLVWHMVTHDLPPVHWITKHRLHSVIVACTGMLFTMICALAFALLHGEPRTLFAVWEGGNRSFFAICVGIFVIAMGHVNVNYKGNKRPEKYLSRMKKVFANAVTETLAPLSYAVYLLHMFVIWVGTEVPPYVTPEMYTVWRFAVSAMQAYIAANIAAVPCHWIERKCSTWLRRTILGRSRGRGRGEVKQTKKKIT